MSAGFALAIGLLPLAATGCCVGWLNGMKTPPTPTCVLSPDATKDEIVQHLNDNTTKLTAWRSHDVHISTTTPAGLPIRLSAHIAVESPRNFRLVAKSFLGNEADFGSNPERFWFWMRRSKPKHVYTVRHDDFDAIRGRFPIPFRPDWLMEALGVIPLDPAQFVMQPRLPDSTVVSLVSNQTTPDGRAARRVVLVDSCVGHIIKQTLYDSAGRTIASAEFNDYKFDPTSGIYLAHEISLDWPQTRTSMTLRIGNVLINPGPMPENLWQMPNYDAELDLAQHLGVRTNRGRVAQAHGSAATTPRNTVPTVDEVGRVRVKDGSPTGVQRTVHNERPVFDDERPATAGERPDFVDEQPARSDAPTRFRKPLIQRNRRSESRRGRAKPFPG